MCAKSQMYVLLEVGAPLSLVDAELDRVGDYDCLVDVLYTSVCGTQVGEIRGTRGPDKFLPHCMGHEGLGIVRSIGNKVSKFLVGDLVYLTWIPCDDSPVTGKRHRCDTTGDIINSGPVVSFATSVVCSSSRLFKVSTSIFGDDIPYAALTPLGCAYATAYGMVKRTGQLSEVEKSDSVAVVGTGGVGLATAIFLGLAGVKSIAIYELDQVRKGAALRLLDEISGCEGVDGNLVDDANLYARVFECSGTVSGAELSYRLTRNSGVCILSGNLPFGAKVSIDPFDILLGKQIVGAGVGNSIPKDDFPEIEQIIASNLHLFESLVTTGYEFKDINDAIFDFEFNSVQRPVIRCT